MVDHAAMNSAHVAVFDMDNCLTRDAWRRDLIRFGTGPTGTHFDAYHAMSRHDEPHALAVNMAVERKRAGFRVAIITSRPERWRGVTREWLESHGVPFDILLMRPDGDLRPSPKLKIDLARRAGFLDKICFAFDDRDDVIAAWHAANVNAKKLIAEEEHHLSTEVPAQMPEAAAQTLSTPEILEQCAATFRERNAVYSDNYKMVGPIMKILFPQGVPPELLGDHAFHLFELMIVKLSRLAISRLEHRDSARDTAVYAAMIEAIILEKENEEK